MGVEGEYRICDDGGAELTRWDVDVGLARQGPSRRHKDRAIDQEALHPRMSPRLRCHGHAHSACLERRDLRYRCSLLLGTGRMHGHTRRVAGLLLTLADGPILGEETLKSTRQRCRSCLEETGLVAET